MFYLKNDCENEIWKLFAPEGQIEIEKIDTQTVWKAEKRLKLFPWVVTNQNCLKKNLFDQRKRRIEILPSDNFKSWKEAF